MSGSVEDKRRHVHHPLQTTSHFFFDNSLPMRLDFWYMKIKPFAISLASTIALISSLFLVHTVRASAWEWLTGFRILPSDGTCCTLGETIKFNWHTHTAGAYRELRKVYYVTSSDSSAPPATGWAPFDTGSSEFVDPPTPFTQDSCQKDSTIDGEVEETCFTRIPHPGLSYPVSYWVRVTTNFRDNPSLCGYDPTPTPDITNCGDTQDLFITANP